MPGYPDHETLAKAHVVTLLLFVVLSVDVVQGGPLQATDADVATWVDARSGEPLQHFARDVLAAPGHTEVAVLLLACGVGLSLWFGVSRNAWFLFLAGTLGMLVVPALKVAFHRPRPTGIITTGAFPSGHAFKATFIVGLVFALVADAYVRRRRGLPESGYDPRVGGALVVAWVVGVVLTIAGRVVGRVHWWTDTLGGVLLGLVLLTATLLLHATLPETARQEATDDLLVGR